VELWTSWLSFLSSSLSLFSTHFGLSEAVAIIALTAVARLVLMPVSLRAAYQGELSRRALERLKPELLTLRETFKDDRAQLSARTMQLYRDHGINPLGRWGLLNIGSQAAFGIGVFQILQRADFSSRFLWITNLAKPDFWLTAVVTVLMLLGVALMPGTSMEVPMVLVLAIPLVIAVVAIAAMPSAIGIYWATSNAFTVLQAVILRAILPRTVRPAGSYGP
jgi:YidC/Oxa1 family membrane protein insertase